MPKVDPESGEPMTDAPGSAPEGAEGGRSEEEAPSGANPQGSAAPTQQGD